LDQDSDTPHHQAFSVSTEHRSFHLCDDSVAFDLTVARSGAAVSIRKHGTYPIEAEELESTPTIPVSASPIEEKELESTPTIPISANPIEEEELESTPSEVVSADESKAGGIHVQKVWTRKVKESESESQSSSEEEDLEAGLSSEREYPVSSHAQTLTASPYPAYRRQRSRSMQEAKIRNTLVTELKEEIIARRYRANSLMADLEANIESRKLLIARTEVPWRKVHFEADDT